MADGSRNGNMRYRSNKANQHQALDTTTNGLMPELGPVVKMDGQLSVSYLLRTDRNIIFVEEEQLFACHSPNLLGMNWILIENISGSLNKHP